MRAPVATPAPPAAAAAPAPAPAAAQDQASKMEALRNLHAAAINDIDADDTPRNSLKDKLQYEEGENSMSVLFNEEPQAQPQAESPQPQNEPEPPVQRQVAKKNRKKNKKQKQN